MPRALLWRERKKRTSPFHPLVESISIKRILAKESGALRRKGCGQSYRHERATVLAAKPISRRIQRKEKVRLLRSPSHSSSSSGGVMHLRAKETCGSHPD